MSERLKAFGCFLHTHSAHIHSAERLRLSANRFSFINSGFNAVALFVSTSILLPAIHHKGSGCEVIPIPDRSPVNLEWNTALDKSCVPQLFLSIWRICGHTIIFARLWDDLWNKNNFLHTHLYYSLNLAEEYILLQKQWGTTSYTAWLWVLMLVRHKKIICCFVFLLSLHYWLLALMGIYLTSFLYRSTRVSCFE